MTSFENLDILSANQENLKDHERNDNNQLYIHEKFLYSPSLKPSANCPPLLTLHKTINSNQWNDHQLCHNDANIGDIIFVRDVTPLNEYTKLITYALQRIDAPHRWTRYCIYHTPAESFIDVIRHNTQ